MMARFEQEILRHGFDKFKFYYDEPWEWFHSAKHRIDEVDLLPHSHPFYMESWILKGGYIERIYTIHQDGTWTTEEIERKKGDQPHIVRPDTIHEIIALPYGTTWTEIVPWGVHQPEYEWKFDETGIYYRSPKEQDFKRFVYDNRPPKNSAATEAAPIT